MTFRTGWSKHWFRIAGALFLGLPAVWLLAMGPRGNDTTPKDRVVVEYWEKWTGEEGAALKVIVDQFNDTEGKKKRIFVRLMSTSSVDQKTLVATAAGTPPDIAGIWSTNIPQFAAMGSLEPLDDLATAHGITSETYKKVYWDECQYDGKLYALVSTPYDVALYYNKDLLAQAGPALRAKGLDPNRPPATLAELDQYAACLDHRDESGHLSVIGYLPNEPGWYIDYTCLWFGGNWWDDVHKKFTFTDPRVVAGYKWAQGYADRLGKSAVADFRGGVGTFDSPQNSFMAQTLAMEQQGTFMSNFIHNKMPSMDGHWAAAPFPSAVPGLTDVTCCVSDVVVIPKAAKHKKEAFEFLAYLNSQPVMEQLCIAHCKTSPLRNVSENFLTHHRNPDIRLFERLAASPNAHSAPPIPILPEVVDEMAVFTQKLMLKETTPEAGLAELQETLQKKYDDFMAIQSKRRE